MLNAVRSVESSNVRTPACTPAWLCTVVLLVALTATATGRAQSANVAVAANFISAANEVGALFEQHTGHTVVFSSGSTGQLYTQISQGAPFDAFLAADQQRPAMAEDQGLAVPGSRFTYATGRLVLFSRDDNRVQGPSTLEAASFATLAIANPVTAPYGSAAVEVMKALGVYTALERKIIQGTNIAQTYQFVETGNAELGFVAFSQVATHERGSRWLVPEELHSTLAQDAVLLKRGQDNAAAQAFLDFLRGEHARAVKDKYGYGAGN